MSDNAYYVKTGLRGYLKNSLKKTFCKLQKDLIE